VHPAHAVDEGFVSRPEDVRELLRALPPDHFEIVADDEPTRGRPALQRALGAYNEAPRGSTYVLMDRPGGLHVHAEWQWWFMQGVLHPVGTGEGAADPASPVVLVKRSGETGGGFLLLYGGEVLRLAERVLGHGLAYWALCGEPPATRTYPQAFPFGSWWTDASAS
jgi:hypothetical protein